MLNRDRAYGCLRLVQLQSRPTAVAGCSNETTAEVYDYRDERTGGPAALEKHAPDPSHSASPTRLDSPHGKRQHE
jgi:hypothetical protein